MPNTVFETGNANNMHACIKSQRNSILITYLVHTVIKQMQGWLDVHFITKFTYMEIIIYSLVGKVHA